MNRFCKKSIFRTLICCLTLGTRVLGFSQGYTITDLGSNTWYYSEAHGINGKGHVTGEYEPTNYPAMLSGFLYADGTMTDVGRLGGVFPYSIARAVNDAEMVTGESAAANNTHAFAYRNGVASDLGSKAGPLGYSSAYAINSSGQIAGDSSVSFSQLSTIHAMLFDGGAWKDLGALGADYSAAFAINNLGLIAGETDVVESGVTNVHAFVYTNAAQPATMHDLGTLSGGTYSSARAVNDSGAIAGESDTVIGGNSFLHAFVWRNGSMTDLQTLGGTVSSASAINTDGHIVGYATDANEVSCAFLYNGSTMVNLNDFIPSGSSWTNLAAAEAINDAGQIAGYGYLADGSFHAYLLTPTNSTPPLTLLLPMMLPGGSFQVTVQGGPGETFTFQGSPDLVNWSDLSTNTLTGMSTNLTDANATSFTNRYYRAVMR